MIAESSIKPASYPALAALGLRAEHLAALARQETLSAEVDRRGGRLHKLRFRLGREQCVRYVGANCFFVDLVRRELAGLQARTKSQRALQRLMRESRAALRRTKKRLEPLLPLAGLCFHGREIRRRARLRTTCVDGVLKPLSGDLV